MSNTGPTKQIVWIVGPRSAGKETFIRQLITNEDLAMQYELNQPLVASRDSFLLNDQVASRESVIDQVKQLIIDNNTVLIKWHYLDSRNNRIEKLKAELPDVYQRAIVLVISPQTLSKRLKEKADDKTSKYYDPKLEMIHFQKYLATVYKELPVTWSSAEAGKNYGNPI